MKLDATAQLATISKGEIDGSRIQSRSGMHFTYSSGGISNNKIFFTLIKTCIYNSYS